MKGADGAGRDGVSGGGGWGERGGGRRRRNQKDSTTFVGAARGTQTRNRRERHLRRQRCLSPCSRDVSLRPLRPLHPLHPTAPAVPLVYGAGATCILPLSNRPRSPPLWADEQSDSFLSVYTSVYRERGAEWRTSEAASTGNRNRHYAINRIVCAALRTGGARAANETRAVLSMI